MKVSTSGELSTKQVGVKIGSLLRGGDVIELIGDVGAGKTTLVKGIGVGLGVQEDIQSPSFTVSRTYETGGGSVLAHYDFYRLNDAGVMSHELHEAVSDSDTIVVVEWSDVVGSVLPSDRVRLRIVPTSEEERELEFTAGGSRSTRIVEGLK